MHLRYLCLAALLAAAPLSWPTLAQEITRDEVPTVMANCERQRESMIAPEREQAVNRCIDVEELDRRTCEQRYRDFGERNYGGNPQGVGWDLPVCRRAEGAQEYFSENPDSNQYAY